MKLFLIDTLAPFFAPLPRGGEYNWSKVPFAMLEGEKGLTEQNETIILQAFEIYLDRVKDLGYNALTVDELCRMVSFDFYSEKLRKKLERYESFYSKLFAMISDAGLKIYVTTDIMFYNSDIEGYIGKKKKKESAVWLLKISIRKLFRKYPRVSGVIFRLGESDGMDVKGDFLSRLYIKKPEQCRKLIRDLLPAFEEHEKHLVIRTWTLGAYAIGDLMWNPITMDKVFRHLDSDSLIISHKYGETDFFRYLNLNPHFFREGPQKIVELQARREYEGFGEFPCYVGKDYEKIKRYLESADNMIGIMVWGQTGGWSHFSRLAYGRNSSLWVELNIDVIIKLFRYGKKADEAVLQFAEQNLKKGNPETFLKLVKTSDRVLRNLWYIPEFSSRRMYFRRTRIPTLLWIVWDNVLISHSLRRIIRPFVLEKKEAVVDGYRALKKIRKLRKYAAELGIDTGQFDFMYDTFRIIANAREYYLSRWNPEIQDKINELAEEYREKYPKGFHVVTEFSLVQPRKWLIKTLFKLAIRHYPEYRLIDKVVLIRFSSLIYFFVSFWNRNNMPEFLEEKAMGVQTLLK